MGKESYHRGSVQFGSTVLSADVSETLLRGLTFEALHAGGAGEHRRVTFHPPSFPERWTVTSALTKRGDSVWMLLGWLLALQRAQVHRCKSNPPNMGAQIFCKHVAGRLALILSVHIVDLKLCGEEPEPRKAVASFEDAKSSLTLHVLLPLENFA